VARLEPSATLLGRVLVPRRGRLHRITGSKASFGFDAKDNSLINNRQNGRRRGRGGGNNNPRQGGGGGGGRADSGNRIDSRARGNANQLYEKYKNLARDAQMSGDRVNVEYYLQYADHYFRVLADTRSRFEDNNQPRRQQPFDVDGDDDDDNNEGEPIRSGEQNGRDDRGNRDAGRDNGRDRDGARDGGRDGNRQRNQRPARDDNHDEDAGNDERVIAHRRPRGADSDAERNDDRPQRGSRGARDSERAASRDAAPQEAVASDGAAEEEPMPPRRRGRPRKEQPVEEGSAAIAADVLPPSLGVAANDADEAPKPRRRRIARASEDVPSAAE
jgi:hypothetical protein